jgi:hypothetical protein
MSSPLSSQEALQLTAMFAFIADRMRAGDEALQVRASICETASRIAFLTAHRLAKREEIVPFMGAAFRPAMFAIA